MVNELKIRTRMMKILRKFMYSNRKIWLEEKNYHCIKYVMPGCFCISRHLDRDINYLFTERRDHHRFDSMHAVFRLINTMLAADSKTSSVTSIPPCSQTLPPFSYQASSGRHETRAAVEEFDLRVTGQLHHLAVHL